MYVYVYIYIYTCQHPEDFGVCSGGMGFGGASL